MHSATRKVGGRLRVPRAYGRRKQIRNSVEALLLRMFRSGCPVFAHDSRIYAIREK
jgi:hypothetical protein